MKRYAALLFVMVPLMGAAQTTIQNTTYPSGQVVTVIDGTVAANTNVTVSTGANVKFVATTSITLGPGVTVSSGATFRACLDSDGDGIDDAWEVAMGLNPNNPADAVLDPDGDGKSNLVEYKLGTNPNAAALPDSANATQLTVHRPKQ